MTYFYIGSHQLEQKLKFAKDFNIKIEYNIHVLLFKFVISKSEKKQVASQFFC